MKQKKVMYKVVISLVIMVLAITAISCNNSPKEAPKQEAQSPISIVDNMSSFNEIINGDTPVLVDFYADWCAPCRMMSPILQQVAREMEGKVKVIKIDVDKNGEAAQKYGVRSIPTLILFQKGAMKWQGVGVMQADQLKSIIQQKS